MVKEKLICKTLVHVSLPAGKQAGRAGAAVVYPQALFLLLSPLEPVILWTGAQEKAE